MLSSVILGFASIVAAQQYTKSPTAPAPAGCTDTYSGSFEVGITQLDAASKLKRQSEPSIANALVITLLNGVLTDNTGRNGYIAANDQFQFDSNGGQAGTKYNSGFSVCANNTLALGGSAVWWECLSGDFYNIYDADWAPQCKPAYLNVATYTGSKSASATGTAAAAQTDVASTSATATGSASVSVSTSVVVSTSSNAGVSSIGDGQIQGPTTTSSVVITSTTSSLTTITPTPSSTTTVGPVLTSITDHQIQAPTTTASVTPYTGAAAMPTAAAGLLLAAAGAAVALL